MNCFVSETYQSHVSAPKMQKCGIDPKFSVKMIDLVMFENQIRAGEWESAGLVTTMLKEKVTGRMIASGKGSATR
jgi:hypothetical protein